MTNVKEIEKAIEQLPKSEVAELAVWFEKFESELWDDQIERDATTGRFDAIYSEAAADFESGQTREL